MGIPHIADRMRSAPVQALRSVFTGIGRILLAADRLPARAADEPRQTAAGGDRGERGRPEQRAPASGSAAESRFRSLDRTGNVRLLSPDDPAEGLPSREQPARPGTPEPAAPEPAAPAGPAVPPELPLPSYDTLSVASIRARLRTLSADQLRVLIGYEQSHAERPEVLGMLERRIEKLETAG